MQKLHESLNDFLSEAQTWTATSGKIKIAVTSTDLKPGNEARLLQKLNKAGFNLGSGHEEITLQNQGKDFYLRLVPYYGHSGQTIKFTLNEENPGVQAPEASLGVQLYRQTAAPTIAL